MSVGSGPTGAPGRGKPQWTVGLVVVLALAGLVVAFPGPTTSPATARLARTVAPTATATARPTVAATPVGVYAARLPRFPAAPVPEPVTVPAGASAGWYSRIPTTQPVAFVTIDDGWIKRPEARQLLAEAQVPVTLFLTIDAIKENPDYFRQLQLAAPNVAIEAHTLTHQGLRGKSYATQKREICGSADRLGTLYGRRPVLFRPPFGEKDGTTLRAVHDCGLKAAFFWTESVDKGKVRYQGEHKIHPGDIILMHFRDRFVDDLIAALNAIHAAGLTPAVLGDYIR
ncbi:polysaccharide deacetylase family protein [Micromonospora sp. NBC_01796]|uniref:polysaccharide deacetylase family protein n=1 Tax=Micromonospora sp. NBC_01796 TaxID=2975987 RepID=UPI002DDC65AC|nr:polysaccharide deacetylase family protein [Micromonospora sp. NBC_01796]WSA87256.1 polysaccharide deacetylase family protein [Micromonospora sp. NBC_01796]